MRSKTERGGQIIRPRTRTRKVPAPKGAKLEGQAQSGEVLSPIEDFVGLIPKLSVAYGDDPEVGEEAAADLAQQNFQARFGHEQEKTRTAHRIETAAVEALKAQLARVNTELVGTDPRLTVVLDVNAKPFWKWRLQDKLETTLLVAAIPLMLGASVLTAQGALVLAPL